MGRVSSLALYPPEFCISFMDITRSTIMNGFPDATAARGRCCLLVTDAQHDFCEGALPAPGGVPVVQRIGEALNRLKRRSLRPLQASSDPNAGAWDSVGAKNISCCKEITSDELIRSISSPSDAREEGEEKCDSESWCDMVVFSLDWHPPDHVSFLASHSAKCVHDICVCGDVSLSADTQQAARAAVEEARNSLGEDKDWTVVVPPSPHPEGGTPSVVRLWPPHCVQNTPGSKLHRVIKVQLGDFAVFKGDNSLVSGLL